MDPKLYPINSSTGCYDHVYTRIIQGDTSSKVLRVRLKKYHQRSIDCAMYFMLSFA